MEDHPTRMWFEWGSSATPIYQPGVALASVGLHFGKQLQEDLLIDRPNTLTPQEEIAVSLGSGRTLLAVIVGYAVNAALVGITEAILVRLIDAQTYFAFDLATQIAATIIAGCLCCLIAQQAGRIAAAGLTALGLTIGTASLVTSWKAEPHWYGIALLLVYAPCVWIGWALVVRREK